MKRYALIALLLLAACAGAPQTRATNALAISCETYSTILDQLIPARRAGKLSADTIKRVDASNDIVGIACAKDSKIDPAAAIETVERGIVMLKAVKEAI